MMIPLPSFRAYRTVAAVPPRQLVWPMAREGAGVIQHKIHLRKELHLIILYTSIFVHSVLDLTRLVRS